MTNGGKKLLLVEDEAIIAMSESMTLEDNGFDVVVCSSGEDAHKEVQSDGGISLVLMDIDLGAGMDGTETAEKILQTRDLPVIFLTSHTEEEMVRKVKGITSYGYVIKNSGEFVLIESVNMALKLHETRSELKTSEIEYREIVDGIDSAVVKYNEKGRIIFFSRGAERIFGFRAEEVIGSYGTETINPKIDSTGINQQEMMNNIFENPEKYRINENENITKDGRRLWMVWKNNAVFDQEGNKLYLLCVGSDITELQKVRTELYTSEQLFFKAFLNAPAIMSISSLDTKSYIEVNKYYLKITGFTREEIYGKTSTEIGLVSAGTADLLIKMLARQKSVHGVPIQLTLRTGEKIDGLYSGEVFEVDGEHRILSMTKIIN
jgi:PAS domain S-box-containing protein